MLWHMYVCNTGSKAVAAEAVVAHSVPLPPSLSPCLSPSPCPHLAPSACV